MLKKICFPLALCVSTFSSAQLVSLNQDELLNTVGQGGADLSWTLSLNHKYANDMRLIKFKQHRCLWIFILINNGGAFQGEFINLNRALNLFKHQPLLTIFITMIIGRKSKTA